MPPALQANLGRCREILHDTFGFRTFRHLQEEIIAHVVGGHDGLVLMPTGGGKSLCYQIPSMVRPGTGIVISPLIALMEDQVAGLLQMGVKAAFLNSSLPAQETVNVENQLVAGHLDLLYVAPERLLTDRFLHLLEQSTLALFAIDEAHCVSQWGHDFRPEYTRLSILEERFSQVPRLAMTATADMPTRKDIQKHLGLTRARVFATGFDRPNIRYTVIPKNNPHQQLLQFIRNEHSGESGIVYRFSRKKVDQTASWLADKGLKVLPYHAGMDAHTRRTNQDQFMREEGIIMVATVAFGMGVDKADIRFVAHLEPPRSMESYYQETGRAGRDGLPADAWMTYGFGDIVAIRQMVMANTLPQEQRRIQWHKLEALLGFLETASCRRQALLGYFGDAYPEPCGNCDNCLHPLETWDGTIAAQKALSNIFKTGQRFGVGHLTEVLLGNTTQPIIKFGHHKVSTFGIGTELDKRGWASVYRQLASSGSLYVDMEHYGALKLNDASWAILRGQKKVRFRTDPTPPKSSKKTSGSRAAMALTTEESRILWESLRNLRKDIASRQNVPPYTVFADKTLLEMVTYRPTDLESMRSLYGIGRTKLDRYGQLFLDALTHHEAQHGRPTNLPDLPASEPPPMPGRDRQELSKTEARSLDLFARLGSIDQVAEQRGLKPTTITNHLAQAIALGKISVQEVTGLSDQELAAIQTTFADLTTNGQVMLKPVFEALGGKYDYGILRCVHKGMCVD
ncbi:DNA helicase RecQ [Desulfoplanes formicivorans]|uniref:DNA helicase RecQ n=1 Tax=Desulfoplanes formicivorans TaxID=1592317 RepID=A0A194AH66_9BACT|nr:DNA helicase RecQ [Desulfoplanes formicivorans]GAU08104.1 ATP-dependent DNA helicase RecQ [Desulfoplanes formicivorans]